MAKIILLKDIYELRTRKEQELEFYHSELLKLQQKLSQIKMEINLTNTIIEMIEGEKVIDLKDWLERKG